ncbi:MAG: S8 family serine peptidase, partial [Bacteroidota bacterium]
MKNQLKTLAKLMVLSVFLNSCEKDANEFESNEIGSETTETMETIEAVGAAQAIPGEYIVVYKENKSLAGKALQMKAKTNQVLSKNGIKEDKVKYVYDKVAQGFAIKNLSEAELGRLKEDDQVAYIQPNYIYQLDIEKGTSVAASSSHQSKASLNDSELSNGEILPWGVQRVGSRDGTGKRCWIIDSGIASHDDLIIDTANSKSFVEGNSDWRDENGHGTHVAGIVAAKKNRSGVIGVAYGATVVSIRVANATGQASIGATIAAADYVAGKIKPGDVWNASIIFDFFNQSEAVAMKQAFTNLGNKAPGVIAAG